MKPEEDDIPVVLIQVNTKANVLRRKLANTNRFGPRTGADENTSCVRDDNAAKKRTIPTVRTIDAGSSSRLQLGLQQKRKSGRSNQKRFKCQFCDHSYNSKSNLNVHSRIHTGETPYQCHCCRKRFKYAASLKSHMKLHIDEFPFHCSACHLGFLTKTSMDIHTKTCKTRLYECFLCKKTFNFNKSNLLGHMRSAHTGTKPFRCEICMKYFRSSFCLKRHVDNIHAVERN